MTAPNDVVRATRLVAASVWVSMRSTKVAAAPQLPA
jgi:hypothetical protein